MLQFMSDDLSLYHCFQGEYLRGTLVADKDDLPIDV